MFYSQHLPSMTILSGGTGPGRAGGVVLLEISGGRVRCGSEILTLFETIICDPPTLISDVLLCSQKEIDF